MTTTADSPSPTACIYYAVHDDAKPRPLAADAARHQPLARCTKRAPRSLLGTLLFAQGDAIYRISKQRALDFDDLLELREQDATATCFSRFHAQYERRGRSLWRAMLFAYGRAFAACGAGQLFVAACGVFAPVVLHHVVSAFSADGPLDVGNLSVWLGVFFLSRILTVLAATQCEFALNHIALRVTAAMKSLLFQKAMRRSTVTAAEDDKSAYTRHKKKGKLNVQETTKAAQAEISNLVSSDTNGVLYAVLALHNVWILPLQVVVVTYLLFDVLDVAAFAGVTVVVMSLGMNYFIARVMGNAYARLMKVKDERMTTVKEVFGAIQTVKFNAWESRFQATLTGQRTREVQRLATYCYAGATSAFVLWSSPLFVSTVSFAVYALVLEKTLTAAKVFTAMALFNALRDPLRDLPTTIQSLIQSRISIKRLDTFLASPEFDAEIVQKTNNQDIALRVKNATCALGSTVVLKNVDFTIENGDFAVVHGRIGAGKSSLLNLLLGEVQKIEGDVAVSGQVAYYSQQPWIQNMTIRENILFGASFNAKRYDEVLYACCLEDDLKLFPAGDATEIGEKGVNLSGGQKARIALARACYADASVYLLDSPLAAVDTVVQKKIFKRCLCGFLEKKTVVLVTHNPEILQSLAANVRLHVDDGRIIELKRTEPVKSRIQTVAGEVVDNSEQDSESAYQEEEEITDPEVGGNGVLVHDEERQEGQIATAVWWRYIDAIGGIKLLVLLLVTLLAWQGFQIGSDFWLSHWTGDTTAISQDRVASFTKVYSALACAGALMVLVRGIIVSWMGLKASVFLFGSMTDGLLHAPLRFFDANPIGRIINRYADDISSVDIVIPASCSNFLSSFFSTVCALFTAAITVKYVGACVIPIIYLYVRIAKGYVRTFCDVRRMLKVVNSPILSHITQSEQGVTILRAFGPTYITRAIDENHRRIDVDNALWDTEIVMIQWFALRMQFLGTAIVIIVVSSFVIFSDWFSPGIVGLAFTYALSIDGSLMALMKAWSKAENNMVSVERVLEYSALEREGESTSAAMLQVEPSASWPERGEIAFDRVFFAYKPNDPPVLHGVSLSILKHEKVGIVGRTGAGKSSLTMALFRMNELTSGRIVVDGVDIATLPLAILRSRIAIIPQSPVLLEGTLRHFLDPFDDYSDEEILRILEHVDLMPTLSAARDRDCDGGYTFAPTQSVLSVRLSSNGDNFSVGERQMMCMARALLRKCAIVIMDEATAAMDHATEARLSRMIRRELKHVTLLTIAHRLATVMDSDRILVLDAGRVVEFDAPQQLLRDPVSTFSALVQSANLTTTPSDA